MVVFSLQLCWALYVPFAMDKLISPSSPRLFSFPSHHARFSNYLPAKSRSSGCSLMMSLWARTRTMILAPACGRCRRTAFLSPYSEELSKLLPSLSAPPAPQRPAAKRRGRKPGPRPGGGAAVSSHVESERQRRDKLNRRFCDLRAAVPTVSRMDKASLLADAARYIAELRARVAQLESEARHVAVARWERSAAADGDGDGQASAVVDGELYVREVGRETAVVRVTSGARHAPALLMGALRSLELQVQHACVSRVHGVTTQDVVVDVLSGATALQDDGGLRTALLQQLQASD